jgi:cell division protein FtsQ
MPRVRKPRAAPVVQDRPSQWRVLLRRQRRLLPPAAIGLALLVICGAGFAGLHALNRGQSLRDRLGRATAAIGLRVRDVEIVGRQKTPEPMVRAALGVIPGEPILTYGIDAARARIETIQWVASASVRRVLPDTLVVNLTERRPFAVWQHDGHFALIDRDGQMVTDSDMAAFANQLPLVVGSGAAPAAATLLDALATQPDLQKRVEAAVRVGERRWNLRLNNGTDVMLPEGAEPQALKRLAELQADHALLDRPLQTIDLRFPDRMVLRPMPSRAGDGRPDKDTSPQTATRKPT